MFCVVASLLAGPRYSGKKKFSPYLPCSILYVALRLQSVATHHMSVCSVIYVHEGLYNGVCGNWKWRLGSYICKSCEAMASVGQ